MPSENSNKGERSSPKTTAQHLDGIPVKANTCVSVYLPLLTKQLRAVGIGQTSFASGNNSALGTEKLASCYALIVLGQTKQGLPLLGLNHWIGDETRAETAIIEMKNELLRRGAQEEQIKCLALGGHCDFPAMKIEIQELMRRGLIQAALFDLNEGGENTALIVSSAPGNKISIDFETKEAKAVEVQPEQNTRNLPTYLNAAPALSLREKLIKEAIARAQAQTTPTNSEDPLEETKKYKF